MFEIREHKSASYAPRTYHNAASSDLTVAFATDFSTAGEKLTKKAAAGKYVSIDLSMNHIEAARELYKACRKFDVKVLNIAGNGIYTLSKSGWTQQNLNHYLYDVVSLIHQHWPLKAIISGGQTGVDMAGGVVAKFLNVPCTMTYPKGFKLRFEDGQDVEWSKDKIADLVGNYMSLLQSDTDN